MGQNTGEIDQLVQDLQDLAQDWLRDRKRGDPWHWKADFPENGLPLPWAVWPRVEAKTSGSWDFGFWPQNHAILYGRIPI